uniref:Uncharacterized protein n=1 Tax=Rhizophora mucronata TaxID=61149 RepID=A0A2P2K3K3_RHIMU
MTRSPLDLRNGMQIYLLKAKCNKLVIS